MADADAEKAAVGRAAAGLVEPGMRVGLGTGSTAAWFVRGLGERGLDGLRCVATSPATGELARSVGLAVEGFDGPGTLERLDIAVDGADELASDGWAMKGGGGAHLRERIVAAAAERFVVIVSAEKLVGRLTWAVPLELRSFGLASTLAALGDGVTLRDAPLSPDGGLIADYAVALDSPELVARRLDATAGVAAHGLFAPELIAEAWVAEGDDVRRVLPG